MNQSYDIGSVVFNNWVIKRKIGEGSFGKVFEIQREDFGNIYTAAMKVITVPQNADEYASVLEEGMTVSQSEKYFYSVVEDIVREFAIMAKLKGTGNVVSYEDHMVLKHTEGLGWDILIRMELLTPLMPYVYDHPMARRAIIRLGIDLCKALELCQKYNIIHRDIKPENIFVSDNGDFKLGDFGIARTIEKTMSGLSKKGTYNYMAPEVYRGSEYGFNVDLYSLGIVLYRMLNKNRAPFLPDAPQPITFHSREEALAKRMAGEKIPAPFHGEGRLGEIVLKACAFRPEDRYFSPTQMREDLEAILYTSDETDLIYPDGDELELIKNQYTFKDSTNAEALSSSADLNLDGKTVSGFGSEPGTSACDLSQSCNKTVSGFHDKVDRTISGFDSFPLDGTVSAQDKTVSSFGSTALPSDNDKGSKTTHQKSDAGRQKKNKKSKIGFIIIPAVLSVSILIFGFLYIKNQNDKKAAAYQDLMQQASSSCGSDPQLSLQKYTQAHELFPEYSQPLVGRAYALYCSREYDACITYIEDELAMGKQWDVSVQNQLSEILAAAYFENADYANAAAFFRMCTAGEDVTVNAMRDYAVSLGRMGDADAAEKVLAQMIDEGAEGEVTAYVQAEIDCVQKEYLKAESGFQAVLAATRDENLQRRCVHKLAELYRDCTVLERTEQSPISEPAVKAAAFLSSAVETYHLQYDSVLCEILAKAYFDAAQANPDHSEDYLVKSADSFKQLQKMGIQQEYIYCNLYAIYYQLNDYKAAEQTLADYQKAYTNSYRPHALRAIMLITIENNKPDQSSRDFSAALTEYDQAQEKCTSSDDTSYLQQLEGLIEDLRAGGWI